MSTDCAAKPRLLCAAPAAACRQAAVVDPQLLHQDALSDSDAMHLSHRDLTQAAEAGPEQSIHADSLLHVHLPTHELHSEARSDAGDEARYD